MAIQTAQGRENLAIAYGTNAPYAALYTTVPGATAGTEVTGGTPAYARKALTWAAGTPDGVVTATAVFDVPAGVTIAGAGVHTALTGGSYVDGGSITSQAFATQGTYTLTLTFTQS
jgi:hypothetical protein